MTRLPGSIRRHLHFLVPLLLFLAGLGIRLLDPPLVHDLRFRAFDGFQALKPRPYHPVPVRLVVIDDESLKRIGQWPWPRTIVARLIRRLQDAGAAAIGLDVIFAEPDRTSPTQVVPLWPDTPETRAFLEAARRGELPDHDQVLAETMARGRVVTAFAAVKGERGEPPVRKAGLSFLGENPKAYVTSFPASVGTLPQLVAAAAGNGTVTVIKDPDAIVRGIPLLLGVGDDVYPSLAIEALRVAQGASGIVVKVSGTSGTLGSGADTGIQAVKVGELTAPTDPHGRLLIYDTAPVPERFIAAWRVLADDFDPSTVEGMIVFVGATAVGLFDLHATPLHPTNPGVVQHALVSEQILDQSFLRHPAWAEGVEIVYLSLLNALILAAFLFSGSAERWGALVALCIIPASAGFSWYQFSRNQLLLDPIFPSLSALVVYLSAVLANYLKSEGERRYVRAAFSQYLSPEFVDQIARDPSKLKLGGEEREITTAFSDIRGFTTLSEHYDAQSLTRLINRYLTPMTDLVLQNKGTIDKYIGDAIMCFWNAPLDDPWHARHACETALAMFRRLEQLNVELAALAEAEKEVFRPIHIGLGMNTGRCVVGNMGSDQRFDYTALGDPVNLASRLEGQSKAYDVRIVMGESTATLVPEFALLELDLIQVKGKYEPTRIFTLLGDPSMRADPDFQRLAELHNSFLEAYRTQSWSSAENLLIACREFQKRFLLQGFYDLYAERIGHYATHPPPPEWRGVYTALTK